MKGGEDGGRDSGWKGERENRSEVGRERERRTHKEGERELAMREKGREFRRQAKN